MNSSVEIFRSKINQAYLANEADMIHELLGYLEDYAQLAIHQQAYSLVTTIRSTKDQQSLVEAFLHEYQLNSDEGVVLMGIAEALLRIPDAHTQDVFLQEKLTEAGWDKHLQHSDSLLVNFATQALVITGKIENQFELSKAEQQKILSRLSSRLGLPIIRSALKQAMQQLAFQFVVAETIDEASIKASQHPNYRYSFDMLGEAALTASDAERYFIAYEQAIKHLAENASSDDLFKNPSISIKLSALYPRYEPFQRKQAILQISQKLMSLVKLAHKANISVTIDAEESERLELSLDIYSRVISDLALTGWPGFGIAVQAYQKRGFSALHWLSELAKSLQCKIPVRLVKGAYWDSEIKRAQEHGLSDYPVFTHKTATDVSYLACAKLMLSQPNIFYPQFATHNAHTVAAILEMGKNHPGYEFQRLHGMGEQLYQQVLKQTNNINPCRIYAPVGLYQDLLPYLVRRLLENGANTSFINQVENPDVKIETVISDPVTHLRKGENLTAQYVLPTDLFGKKRINSRGLNLADFEVLSQLQQGLDHLSNKTWLAAPIVNGKVLTGTSHDIFNPAFDQMIVGSVIYSEEDTIKDAITVATSAFKQWRLSKVQKRASILLKASELIEQNHIELVSLCVREAGKTIKDALAEIREAVDFCRYYAQTASKTCGHPITLKGPTGEQNRLYQYGRGVFVCISPWNFPIAIFIGQVTAALVSGNTVIAKPATQAPLTAMRCIQLLHQAGIPEDVLQFLPGDGAAIGRYLFTDNRVAGVAFTGSLSTARFINQQLAKLPSIVPLIAETGGQNIMIADSSAYREQLIQDVIQSAFNSAGQRCSALRVLFLPDDVADKIITGIIGMMQQLIVANPQNFETDIGPVINSSAVKQLNNHISVMRKQAKVLFQVKLNNHSNSPSFFPPTLIELKSLSQLKEENFGPVLHVIRYQTSELDQVIDDINGIGYGLTMGIHSRINKTIKTIVENSKVGNIYVNRNMISAVVGVQPFGGMGLSGTGSKTGGPHYLQSFCCEQTVSINTAAVGGNTQLLTQDLL